jgi:hypothetical protein
MSLQRMFGSVEREPVLSVHLSICAVARGTVIFLEISSVVFIAWSGSNFKLLCFAMLLVQAMHHTFVSVWCE